MIPSPTYFQLLLEFVRGVYCGLATTLFSACLDWSLGRMSERSGCSASFGNVKICDLDFTDDAVIFVETLDILLGALKVLNEESCVLFFIKHPVAADAHGLCR